MSARMLLVKSENDNLPVVAKLAIESSALLNALVSRLLVWPDTSLALSRYDAKAERAPSDQSSWAASTSS